jgi:hypothetical protein
MIRNYEVKTPNFKYALIVQEIMSPIHKLKFFVENERTPCLEASVFMKDVDERFLHLISEAAFHKIDALKECALESPGSDEPSFGTELLYSFINNLKANFSYVNTLTLQDYSYIPCNREDGDTLDLLTYNIALYGKTWYELKAGATLESQTYQNQYENEIKHYLSLVPHIDMPFVQFIENIARRNDYATSKLFPELASIEETYNTSSSFPEFFQYLNKHYVTKQDKCKFYKDWLEEFINSKVHVRRSWKINIETNPVLGNVLNVSSSRPMPARRTRRKRRASIKN